MKLREEHKKLIVVMFFGLLSAATLATGSLIQQQRNASNAEASTTNFDQHCQDGVYYIQKDGKRISCGRAPNCGGKTYSDVEHRDWRSQAECWVEDYYGGSRCAAYCAGNIPLCCYKLAQTKNPEDCTWPERGYCLPSQCQGVGEKCGGPIVTWCTNEKCVSNGGDIPYIPLENRLSGNSQPPQSTNTPQPTAPPPTNTSTPQNTLPVNPSPTTTTILSPTVIQPTAMQPIHQPVATTAPIATNQPLPTSQPPQTIPTSVQIQIPTTEVKTPKEMAREVINPENIQKLNEKTKVPLEAPKRGIALMKNVDFIIEQTAETWIFKLRTFIENLF